MQKDKLVERFLKHYEKDIIDFALKQKNIITELTDKKISNNAFEYIKSTSNKDLLCQKTYHLKRLL